MKCIGFTQIKERWKQGGRMAYWLYRRDEPALVEGEFERKVVLRPGDRNNFAILL
jgi:25S rRNA (adenine2142-N1)-methyltransferase